MDWPLEALVTMVEDSIQGGWEPFSPMVVDGLNYYQSMVRYELNSQESK